jgi:hypothetical protein
MKLRKWHFIQPPDRFNMAGCLCGNERTKWSEFENHLWCDRCQKDFIPAHNGIFDGPIPVRTTELLGISFDRINLETSKREVFSIKEGVWHVT